MALDHEDMLANLLEAEQQRGQLPENAEVQIIAGYLVTVMAGLSVQARRGKSSEELKALVDMIISSIPGVV